jgi:hypothetical protein
MAQRRGRGHACTTRARALRHHGRVPAPALQGPAVKLASTALPVTGRPWFEGPKTGFWGIKKNSNSGVGSRAQIKDCPARAFYSALLRRNIIFVEILDHFETFPFCSWGNWTILVNWATTAMTPFCGHFPHVAGCLAP